MISSIAALLTGIFMQAASPVPSPPPTLSAAPKPEDARGWEQLPPTPAADVALFVPRLLLTPPRLALTLLFFPIQHGLRFVSRNVTASNSDPTNDDVGRSASVLPHFSFLSGFGATFGGSLAYSNLSGWGEHVALGAAFGGRYAHAVDLAFAAARTAGSRLWLETGTRHDRRSQEVFRGIEGSGAATNSAATTRFREDRLTVRGHAGVTTGGRGGLVKTGVGAILSHSSFAGSSNGEGAAGNASIRERYDTRSLVGFDRGVATIEPQAKLVVDTRETPHAASTGALVTAFAGAVPSIGRDDFAYGHFGLDANAIVDLYRGTRLLVLRGALESVVGADAKIPFSRLPALGGSDRLRGYRADIYRDRTTALVSAEYRYPIHEVVAGALFVDAGNASRGLDGLATSSRWRVGGGAGIRVHTKRSMFFALDVAYGEALQLFLTLFPRAGLPNEERQ